jgi:PAS/PAC sensor hybrid histidine kinase
MTKILLVEDDKSLREIYNVRLGAEGYDIVSAGDGEEALALAIKERPDLIVSDVMMPKISGFDMLDILRSTTETKNVKVIMMTALSNEEQRQRGLALGADRYLVKSQVGIEDVVRTVHEVLEDDSSVATGPAPLVSSDSSSEAPADTSSQEINTAPIAPVSPEPGPVAAPTVAPRPNPASSIPLPPPRSATLQVPQPHAAAQPAAAAAPEPPQPAPAPTATPASAPANPMLAAAPAPAPTAPSLQPSALPQPIAPFSTPRPGSSGRIIQPIEHDDSQAIADITARMSQELAGAQTISNIPAPQPHAAAQPVTTAARRSQHQAPAVQQPAPAPTATPASAPNSEPKLPPTPPAIPSSPSVAPMQPTVVSAPVQPPHPLAQEHPPSAPQMPQAPQPAPSVRPAAPAQPVPAAQTTAAATAQALSIPVQPIASPTGTPPTPAASSPSTLSQQPAVPSAQPATSASISSPAASAPAPADNALSGMQFEETLRTDVPASQRTTL